MSRPSAIGSKASANPAVSPSEPSKKSSAKPGSDRFSVTFSKATSERLNIIREFGKVDPRQFVVNHVECFLNQIWKDNEFAEHVTTTYGFPKLGQAICSAVAANKLDGRPDQWFFFKNEKGHFFAENDCTDVAEQVRKGRKLVATMTGWRNITLVEEDK